MKNILITGGAGFIGSNLTLTLVSKGYNVTVLDNLSKQIHGENPDFTSPLYQQIKDKVRFVLGSVENKTDWEKVIYNQDAIVHLAAETGTGQSMYQIKRYTDVNIGGTSLMLDMLANNNNIVKKVVVASSRSIYGEGKYKSEKYGIVYPIARKDEDMKAKLFETTYRDDKELTLLATDEDSKIHPSSVYGITKQNQEQMVMTVCPTIGIAPVAFRFQNVYGPGQSLSNPYTGILSIFSSLILNNGRINVFEDGLESRDFVFIDDVIESIILGLENVEADAQVFNVGTGVRTNVLEVVEQLAVNYEKDVEYFVSGNYRLGDIRHNYADLSKINKLLNFKPRFDFKTGIKLFANWVKDQNILSSQYELSLQEMRDKGLFK